MQGLTVGSLIELPLAPRVPASEVINVQDPSGAPRGYRKTYDWKAYTPAGLALMERYWDGYVELLAGLLPDRVAADRATRGINLGTFNGAFQKAWMRRGHPMYGIELDDAIAELHEYGCDGHRDNVFTLSAIDDASFDFAVLDRVMCTEGFYRYFGEPSEKGERVYVRFDGDVVQVPPYFENVMRILKPDAAFIGLLYPWYTKDIVRELASYGALRLWPASDRLLAFRLVRGVPTEIPDVTQEPLDSDVFVAKAETSEGPIALSLPTNEVVLDRPAGRLIEFAPTSARLGDLAS